MTTYAAPAVNAINTIIAGLVRLPCAMLNIASVLIAAEIARRMLRDIAGIFVPLPDPEKKNSAAYYLDQWTPAVAKRMFTAFDPKVSHLALGKALIVCSLLSNIGWAATEALFGAPSPLYNKTLQFLGPLQLNTSYIHPLVTLIRNRTGY